MNTTLRKGQILDSGFEIQEIIDLRELAALGILARHRKSGAQVFHIFNDDSENLFAFATAPEDSTGVAHVLEHSVLCGSQNYPLKDAFLVLAQGSLQTFLNAWTFPDKTVYPASSVNEQDYFNLMAVYADAVFRPLLSEWTFMQEGHRLVFSPAGTDPGQEQSGDQKNKSPLQQLQLQQRMLQITGVVYNEMKGEYSSPETYAGLWSVKGVLPDTPYGFESGGNPEYIPDLTWEALKEFHRDRYSPGNCRIFLAGNIPTEKQLAFLDREFLSVLPPGKAAPPVTKARRWETPRTIQVPCPAGAEQKSTVFLSWLCSDSTDADETLALAALTEILLGHDGSPLNRVLVESGLGEDLAPATGLEGELRETVFTVGLRGVKTGEPPTRVEALILGELRRLASEGIPPEEIEAALLAMEFSNREIRRSHGPYSLVWLRKCLRGWLHGGNPWDTLLFVPSFTRLKGRIAAEDRYFESLIRKYFLDNPHRALVQIEPEAGYREKKEAELAAKLDRLDLSEAELQAIGEKSAELERLQGEAERPEALASIPHLSRRDLATEIERIPREIRDIGGLPVLTHDLFTNGISYVNLAFPLDVFEAGDYPWLPFFSGIIVSLGLPGMDYGEVSSLLARTAGGFHGALQTGSSVSGTAATIPTPSGILDLAGRDWLIFRLKALDEKIGPALDLARRIITDADFSDQRRIRDLVLEMKNDLDASLAPSGHAFASGRSERYFSRSRAVDEIWNGMSQIEFAHRIAALDTAEISRRFSRIRDTLVSRAGLLVNVTGSSESITASLRELEGRFSPFGPPRPRNPRSSGADPFFALLDGVEPSPASPSSGTGAYVPAPGNRKELYLSPSLQIGFAAVTLTGSPYASERQIAELVLAHLLSTGALWEDIRMKGGAYGAFAQSDGIEGLFSLSTYRDPNPLRSLESFTTVLKNMARRGVDDDSLEKAIIGTYGRETRPRTSAEKGLVDFSRFLYGVSDTKRAQRLKFLVKVQADQIAAAAASLAAGALYPVILAGPEIREAAVQGGAAVKELPV
ncbi:MAG: insulinase family protein [Treponema sp.]|jgi:Zn-dependent M16 (insulinase) family peptidase|nr:insulinase family protein [Treponema sp.]